MTQDDGTTAIPDATDTSSDAIPDAVPTDQLHPPPPAPVSADTVKSIHGHGDPGEPTARLGNPKIHIST